jgi:FtsP/CotA-like multicopper oxidase with cupredoxin domain
MSGTMSGKLGTLLGAFGLILTTVAIATEAPSSVSKVSAAPTSATDESKVPHYFGPYPNWANSAQALANAVVEITGGGGTGATATATVLPRTAPGVVPIVVGSISEITVTSPGTGYATAPTVTITSPGMTPTTGATATAAIATGVVTSIAVDEAGFGFDTPAVTITRQLLDPTGAGATATASGGVDNVTMTDNDPVTLNDGGVYTSQFPIVEFTTPDLTPAQGAPAYRRATGTATFTAIPATTPATYTITGVTVVDPGTGYTSAPTLAIFDGNTNTPATVPARTTVTIGIAQIDVTAGGDVYTLPPTVAINDTVGVADKGASATATLATAGAVTGITVTAPGAGYLTPGIRKFVDTLPGLTPDGKNNLNNYIPVAVPDTTTYPGTDYYEIGLVQYRQKFHTDLNPTLLRGYVQLSTPVTKTLRDVTTNALVDQQVPLTNANLNPAGVNGPDDPALLPNPVTGLPDPTLVAVGVDQPRYLGPTIVSTKDRPVRITFRNLLPLASAAEPYDGNLFLPVDTTLMGSGMGPNAVLLSTTPGTINQPLDNAVDTASVLDSVRNPMCGETPKPTECFSEARATLHLHGGVTPWISDGTPHQWITPAGDTTEYPKGVSVSNVPDMVDPGPGAQTFFYTNQQSARLMFYHDHAWGITRLNVYAGEAAGYVITDPMEQSLIAPTGALAGLGIGTPLIVQDKTFVPSPATMAKADPTWDTTRWGGEGNLWTPHVYMPAQNPGDPSGMSSFGRWMYGPWFWPPATDAKYPPIPNPYYLPVVVGPAVPDVSCDPNFALPDGSLQFCEPQFIPSTPNISVGMEAFNDTPMVNGTVYPTTTVDPKAYRYRVLNAANDRFWNLSWYVADPRTGTLSEVALNPVELAAAQTDPVVSPTPDTNFSPAGPSWIQIGSEGGFLPTPVVVPASPTVWITDPTRFDVGNVDHGSLILAPAERADVIVDFSRFRGQTLILYNDAPAAFPARVPGYDYYTGGPDMSPGGAPTTLPGYGPNTRTIMQVKVSMAAPALAFDRPNTLNDRMGALMTAFNHKADGSGVFESSQDPIIVGQAAYNQAYGTNFAAAGWCNSPTADPAAKCDGFARIMEQGTNPATRTVDSFKFKFDTLGPLKDGNGPQLAIPMEPKGMHDEMNSADFDEWGRMTANLGLEAPGATPLLQNIILYPYVNPATELFNSELAGLPSALKVTPISVATDGTQIWKITHNGVDTHPIHFHLYNVQVLNRVTWDNIVIPPDPTELGWKETVRISPLEDTIVAMRPIVPTLPFAVPDSIRVLNPAMPEGAVGALNGNAHEAGFNNTDTLGNPMATPIANVKTNFDWEYVFHCHILSHEEMDMMRPVTVNVDWTPPRAPTGLTYTPGSVILNWTDLTPVTYTDPDTWDSVVGDLRTNPEQEVGFRIERARISPPGGFVAVANAPANATTFTYVPTGLNVSYNYRVTAWNQAGDSPSASVAVLKAASTTVLTTSVNPSAVGQNVTFTATVSSTQAPGVVPTGTVEFFDGIPSPLTSLGSATMAASAASLSTAALLAGSHPITAVYSGDNVFATSQRSVTQTVLPTFTLSGTVTNSVTVTGLAGAQVNVFGAGVFKGTAIANGSGTFSITLAQGSYKLLINPNVAGQPNFWYGGTTQTSATAVALNANTAVVINGR